MYAGDPRYSEFHASAQRGAFSDLAGRPDFGDGQERRIFNTMVASIPLVAIVFVEIVVALWVAR